ncbi:MAG: ABC transporter permease [Verrucomicrobia bacterium]|nr:ABC transporter permease [Verrucomicrobiota bacterium]
MKHAFRQLLAAPGFTAIAILTLALGIGACTAIFSVVNGVLLRPLDYPGPGQLTVIKDSKLPEFPEFSSSPPNFLDWRKELKSFANLAAAAGAPLNLTGNGEPERLIGLKVTDRYFETFGVQPFLGRTFLPEEDAVGKNHVVILSHPFWQRVYGGDATVIGRSLQLNGEPYTVVGIAPPGFGLANKIDAWVPMAFTAEDTANDNRDSHYLGVIGRLKPGVTSAQANAELQVLAARLARQYPSTNKSWSAFATPLLDYSVRDVRGILWILLGAVACVLLIACANIANLLLARATARHREISIRAALGASRARLIRQLLAESVLLALFGGLAGILLARWGLDALLALAPSNLPRTADIHLDLGVLAFALVLSIATGLIFGLAPAWFAARTDVNEALKQGTRGSTAGGARGRIRNAIVVLQIAFALVLLTGAGLLLRSFVRLTRVDPGFNPEHATVLRLTLPQKKYPGLSQRVAFADALLAKLAATPGVQSVGLTHTLPLLGDWVLGFNIDGRPLLGPSEQPNANYYAVTPGYFQAMGIRLVRGRLFTDRDTDKAPRVALISETLARQQFPNEDPIGKRINITVGPDAWREIIGIVGDVKQYGVEKPVTAQAYEPYAQKSFNTLNVVIRTASANADAALLATLRPTVYAVDKDQPVGSVRPLGDIVADSIARQRFATLLLTVFSLIALVIAAVGIYGVMAYTVTQRTSEFGIRLALGAQPREILRLVFTQGARLVALGLALGLLATFALSCAIESMLYNTSTRDPLTLAGITALFALVSALACLLPARRATKVDPLTALRSE